jgi:hypothetical protein
MDNVTQQIANRAWNFAHVLRDAGLSYMAYTEQITFLLFLKMADELIRPPHNRAPLVPQDPNDEPADKLLERIRAERARTGTSGSTLAARPAKCEDGLSRTARGLRRAKEGGGP